MNKYDGYDFHSLSEWLLMIGIVIVVVALIVAVHYLHLIVPLIVIGVISCLVPRGR